MLRSKHSLKDFLILEASPPAEPGKFYYTDSFWTPSDFIDEHSQTPPVWRPGREILLYSLLLDFWSVRPDFFSRLLTVFMDVIGRLVDLLFYFISGK